MIVSFLIGLIFILAIIFTWTSGVQQGSAVAACAVAVHSLDRKKLLLMVFIFEVLGTLFGGSAVAGSIQSLCNWPAQPSLLAPLSAALVTAIIWNFISNRLKMPASATHSLIGATIGALLAGSGKIETVSLGTFTIYHPRGIAGAVISLFLSPILGFFIGYIFFTLLTLLFLNLSKKWARALRAKHWILTAAVAFGDGQNDTQKTLGLLVLALNACGLTTGHDIPLWLRIVIALAMGGGSLFMSDSLIKELAFGVYKLRTLHTTAADMASAGVLITNSVIGAPVSASQVITASLMGAGTAERKSGIHWLVVKDIGLSWLVTVPGAAVIAAVVELIFFQWTIPLLNR